MRRSTLLAAAAALVATLLPWSTTTADEIYTPVTSPVVPSIGDIVPKVENVPGKKFTDSLDMDYRPTPHAVDPSRIGRFDGLGGARNGIRLSDGDQRFLENHIDAQASIRDRQYREVVNNLVPLIFSTRADDMLLMDTALAAEHTDGAVSSFATHDQVVSHPHDGGRLRDINSVDLWTPEDEPAAGFYSFQGEPGGVSVWSHTILGGALVPYITQSQIAAAIGAENFVDLVDVDALMAYDIGTDFNPFDNQFGPGDSILFSIEPIQNAAGAMLFDGGEIWQWDFGSAAQFLKHGGHVWDTAHSVMGLSLAAENVDALEAAGVPEPSSAMLALLAACGFATRRRK